MCLFGWFKKSGKELGKVVHYFDKIKVMVVALECGLKVGDAIKVKRGDEEFTLTVESMQIDHKEVCCGKKGDEVAIKVPKPTKDGAKVYRA